ncbi:MAG TPA: glycosyltransferase family 87 protein [Spirosoma sp.]|nr:glycosyltransferase family 87 protein [Spirosoma sp.]
MSSVTKSIFRINPERHLLLLLVLFYGYTVIYIPHDGGDFTFWSAWSVYIREHGIRHVYDLHRHPAPGEQPSFIYGPVYMYLLYFFGKWQGSVAQIQQNIHQLKVFILVFDMVGIWFALRYLRDTVNRPFWALFLIFNIGLLYNTVSWGQVDGAIACLVLLAVHYALRGQTALSAICVAVALLIKPQPIIFLPVLGLLWLTVVLKKPLRHTVLSLAAVILVILVLLFPFIQAGTLVDYWAMLLDSASVYPVVSVNAGNLWNLLLTADPNTVSDEIVQFGLTYKQWGLLMASIGYLVVLLPLLQQFYQIIRGERSGYDAAQVLLIVGLIPIVFYFFNTQMHERYAHPSVLFLAAYALSTKDFVPYIVASVANFLVMDKFLRLFGLTRLYDYVTLEQVAILFLIVLIWGVFRLYKKRELVRQTEVVPV